MLPGRYAYPCHASATARDTVSSSMLFTHRSSSLRVFFCHNRSATSHHSEMARAPSKRSSVRYR
eukprot:18063-Heterococcus_DN1.PRE.5